VPCGIKGFFDVQEHRGRRHIIVEIKSVTVTLRLAVYRQSVRLGAEPLETHGQNYFSHLNTCDHSPYITTYILPDERMGLSFTIAAGPRQRIHSQVRVLWHSRPHILRTPTNMHGHRCCYSKAPVPRLSFVDAIGTRLPILST
jgi:hypothetical protein